MKSFMLCYQIFVERAYSKENFININAFKNKISNCFVENVHIILIMESLKLN